MPPGSFQYRQGMEKGRSTPEKRVRERGKIA